MINNPIIYKFSKTLLTAEKRLTGQYFLAVDLSPTFLNTGTTDETFRQSGEQDSLSHLLKLVCKKAQAHSSLKPPLEYNQDQMFLTNHGLL